jgi:tRNA dimethylallyltransferase
MSKKYLIVIAGPTASGKTDLAIRIAGTFHTEIISADSRQVYRELCIGTAVPDRGQLSKIKHHLIQHRSVLDNYNASIFEEEALKVLDKIFNKNEFAVLAGGSGLYIKALCDGIDDIPSVDPGVRENLRKKLESEGIESLRYDLKKLDPDTYRTVDLKNPNRILKALEVSITTGKPYSSFLKNNKKQRDFEIIKVGLNLNRGTLYEKINLRVDEMMTNGLLEEVRSCIPYRNRNSLKTVGYKELFEHLDGKAELQEAVRLIKRNTRRFARRQITWFNGDPEIHWFEPGQSEEIIKFIRGHVETAS